MGLDGWSWWIDLGPVGEGFCLWRPPWRRFTFVQNVTRGGWRQSPPCAPREPEAIYASICGLPFLKYWCWVFLRACAQQLRAHDTRKLHAISNAELSSSPGRGERARPLVRFLVSVLPLISLAPCSPFTQRCSFNTSMRRKTSLIAPFPPAMGDLHLWTTLLRQRASHSHINSCVPRDRTRKILVCHPRNVLCPSHPAHDSE